ncbi:MAG: BON domain-containing protein [Pseudomonadota bacterium]
MIRQHLSLAALAVAACALAACASSRSLDDSVSDLATNAELKGVLFTDRSFDYSDVDITLFEGRLMLTGTMRSEDGRRKLVENAWRADGVDQVIDEIFVGDKTGFGQGVADARIDQTLRAKLLTDGDVTSGRYKIAVSSGIVYLLGAARSNAELSEAIERARTTGGVNKVVSHVVVRELNAAR